MAAAAKRPRTILVVDDEPMVRMVIGRLLQKWDFKVVEADSGLSALEMARTLNGALCLVITDLNMLRLPGSSSLISLSKNFPPEAGWLREGSAQLREKAT